MFSDPPIMIGAGVMIAILAIAAAFRVYNRLKAKVASDAASKKPRA